MYERTNEPRKRISVGVLVGLLKRWNTQKHTLLWSWRCFKIIPSGYELAGDAESLVKQRKTAALSRLESFADWFSPPAVQNKKQILGSSYGFTVYEPIPASNQCFSKLLICVQSHTNCYPSRSQQISMFGGGWVCEAGSYGLSLWGTLKSWI